MNSTEMYDALRRPLYPVLDGLFRTGSRGRDARTAGALGLLRRISLDQTCCGQSMVNTGCHKEAALTEKLFVEKLSEYDFIVCPSGGCTHQYYLVDIDLD